MNDLTIEFIRTEEALQSLREDWNGLLARSASDSIFITWEWVSTWWEIFGPQFSLYVATVRDETGTLLGVAPLMIGRGTGVLDNGLRTLMFIGQRGDTLCEYLDVFVLKSRETELAECLWNAVIERRRRDWDFLDFSMVLENSPNLPTLEECLRRAGLCIREKATQQSPYTRLPADWDSFLQAMSKNFRSQWNNSTNRLAKLGTVEMQFAGKDVPIDEAMDTLIALHRVRWGNRSGSFRSEAYLKFHRRLSTRMAHSGNLLLALLRLNDEVIAARYDFLYAGKIWCFQGGWKPDYEKIRIGTILTGRVMEWGIRNGYYEYDFLAGDDHYKQRWATGERRVVSFRVYPPIWRVRLYETARSTRTLLRSVLRSASRPRAP